jgi:hypothetical protein
MVVSEPDFAVDVFQNVDLAGGLREVNAMVTVTAARTLAGQTRKDIAEIVIADCSASMDTPPSKMSEVRRALAAAVDVISDGVAFAIVAGAGGGAYQVYPPWDGLAVASPDSRTAARTAVAGLAATR